MLDRLLGLFRRRAAPPPSPSITPPPVATPSPAAGETAIVAETAPRLLEPHPEPVAAPEQPPAALEHDPVILAEIDEFLATFGASDEERAGVPATFDPRSYLARNLDVLRARANPWGHYIAFGRSEGRVW